MVGSSNVLYDEFYDSSGTNESQTASSKFSFKKVRREKKKNIYIYFHWVAQVARGARERGREGKRNFIKFYFGCILHTTTCNSDKKLKAQTTVSYLPKTVLVI